MVYLSTNCARDLRAYDSDLVRFEPPEEGDAWVRNRLGHEHVWFVTVYGSCSCHFRHRDTADLGFFDRLDWLPEDDEDERESTQAAYDVLKALVDEGCQVDVADFWNNDDFPPDLPEDLDVSLSSIRREEFLFMLDHRFVLRA